MPSRWALALEQLVLVLGRLCRMPLPARHCWSQCHNRNGQSKPVWANLCMPQGDTYAAAAAAVGTDFRQWSEAEVRAFLDQRGEDYDDCPDFEALVRGGGRAQGGPRWSWPGRCAHRAASRLRAQACIPEGGRPLLACSAPTPPTPRRPGTRGACPPLQCKRAAECEANTGPAQRPSLAAVEGADAAAGGDDEVSCAPAAANPQLPGPPCCDAGHATCLADAACPGWRCCA